MNKENIVSLPDPVLRQKSAAVKKIDNEIKQLAESMKAATIDWEDSRQGEVGVALAAVQVGELKQIVVIRNNFDNRENQYFDAYINPKIIKKEEPFTLEPEGCLSIPDIYGIVPRYNRVTIKAQNLDGEPITLQAEGFLARVFQHEIDHNHGELFIDKVKNERFFKIDNNGELKPLTKDEIKEHPILRQR